MIKCELLNNILRTISCPWSFQQYYFTNNHTHTIKKIYKSHIIHFLLTKFVRCLQYFLEMKRKLKYKILWMRKRDEGDFGRDKFIKFYIKDILIKHIASSCSCVRSLYVILIQNYELHVKKCHASHL